MHFASQGAGKPPHKRPQGLSDHSLEPLENRSMFSAGGFDAAAAQPVDASHGTTGAPEHAYEFSLLQSNDTAADNAAAEKIVTPASKKFVPMSVALLPSDKDDVIVGITVVQPLLVSGAGVRQAVSDRGAQALHRHDFESYAGRPPNKQPRSFGPATKGRILLIEDDTASCEALATILRRRGYSVMAASTLADGIRQLATKPDNVIVDLALPDGDGEQLLEMVRSQHMATRVTVVTGCSEPERLAHVQELHPDMLMQKPINLPELLRVLQAGPVH